MRLAGRGGPLIAGGRSRSRGRRHEHHPRRDSYAGRGLQLGRHAALLWRLLSGPRDTVPFDRLAFERATNALQVVKRHFPIVIGVGGAVMIALGLLILTGESRRSIPRPTPCCREPALTFPASQRIDAAQRTALASAPPRRRWWRSVGRRSARHSLGLIAEAIDSATDLVAALRRSSLSRRRASRRSRASLRPRKAEPLSALGEGAILIVASIAIAYEGDRPTRRARAERRRALVRVAVIGAVIVIERGPLAHPAPRRAPALQRRAGRERAALHARPRRLGGHLHRLVLVRAGHPQADRSSRCS